jgi:hypothetical protein
MAEDNSKERDTAARRGRQCSRLEDVSSDSGEQTGVSDEGAPVEPHQFTPGPWRFFAPTTMWVRELGSTEKQGRGVTGERDLPELEAYIRGTIRRAMRHVDDPDEIADLVQQGFLIAEEIQREIALGDSLRQALAARLANRLYDYWRLQHPEVRRNTRARRRAAERGEEYIEKVYQATGLAPEFDVVWDRETLAPQSDVAAEVYDQLKVEELEGITSARELMLDPQKAGLLFGVSSYYLPTARAEWAFEALQDLRLEHRPRTRFSIDLKPL